MGAGQGLSGEPARSDSWSDAASCSKTAAAKAKGGGYEYSCWFADNTGYIICAGLSRHTRLV